MALGIGVANAGIELFRMLDSSSNSDKESPAVRVIYLEPVSESLS